MDLKTEIKLVESSLKLKGINQTIERGIREDNNELIFDSIDEFLRFKKEIKTLLVDISYANIRNDDAREIIRKISMDEDFFADELIKLVEREYEQKTGKKIKYDELTDDEFDELGFEVFFSWFSHYDYVKNMYRIGSLILDISVPKELQDLIREARSCCALLQYNAVYSLCRTTIEVAIRHIIKKKKIKNINTNKEYNFEDDFCIKDLIRAVSRNELRDRIIDLYYEVLSPVVHGKKTTTFDESGIALKKTLEVVYDLYDYHFHRHN